MIVQVAEMQISWSWCQLSEPGNSRNRKWENALFILIILHSRSRLSPPVHRIEYYTSQHTCITQYRRRTVQVRPCLLRLLSLTTFPPCSCVRMSGCRKVGLYLAVSSKGRSGNCSQFRSISVKGPGAVTPGAHPIRYGIVTVTLSTEGAVSSPSIHHRPYLRNRKCPPLLSFKL